jgi:RsiW-degrading membrane proteinase PrsW (M82 family)
VLFFLTALVAPAAFWIGYLYYKDRYQPEPLRTVGLAYLLGIGAGWFCLRAYLLLEWLGLPSDPFALAAADRGIFLAYCVVVIGLLEEVCKLLPMVLVIIRLREFDERLDGFIYASCIALGFATYENLFYLPSMEGGYLWGRALASPLIHTMFSSIWGYTLATAVVEKRSVMAALVAGVGIAAILHGFYDFMVFDPLLRPVGALLVLMIWIWRIRTIQMLHLLESRQAVAVAATSADLS